MRAWPASGASPSLALAIRAPEGAAAAATASDTRVRSAVAIHSRGTRPEGAAAAATASDTRVRSAVAIHSRGARPEGAAAAATASDTRVRSAAAIHSRGARPEGAAAAATAEPTARFGGKSPPDPYRRSGAKRRVARGAKPRARLNAYRVLSGGMREHPPRHVLAIHAPPLRTRLPRPTSTRLALARQPCVPPAVRCTADLWFRRFKHNAPRDARGVASSISASGVVQSHPSRASRRWIGMLRGAGRASRGSSWRSCII